MKNLWLTRNSHNCVYARACVKTYKDDSTGLDIFVNTGLKIQHASIVQSLFNKSPLSGAEKHHDFQVTSCHHFVTTDVEFHDQWKHKTSNICLKTNIFSLISD